MPWLHEVYSQTIYMHVYNYLSLPRNFQTLKQVLWCQLRPWAGLCCSSATHAHFHVICVELIKAGPPTHLDTGYELPWESIMSVSRISGPMHPTKIWSNNPNHSITIHHLSLICSQVIAAFLGGGHLFGRRFTATLGLCCFLGGGTATHWAVCLKISFGIDLKRKCCSQFSHCH